MSNEIKKNELEENIKRSEESIVNLENIETQEFNSDFVTKKELNEEARIRAENDQIIIDDLNILRKLQNNKINNLGKKVTDEEDKISEIQERKQNKLDDNLTTNDKSIVGAINEVKTTSNTQERNIQENTNKISKIENCFWDEINRLAQEKTKLNSQLKEANEVISKKDNEIKNLKEEIANNGAENDINLRFTIVPKFEINEVMSVKSFINQYLKDLVTSRMEIRHPGAKLGQDYDLIFDGLAYDDIVQGKNIIVIVKAIKEGKLIGQSNFEIEISYKYDALQQEKFVEELLQPAIPFSLRNVPENASPDYSVQTEIVNTKPLKLLLHDKDFKYLPVKVFAELNAASSYWTDFHRSWQFIKDNYSGTGQSTIGGSKKINNVTDLYTNSSGYYQNIFKLIEQKINDSGVPCKINKKLVHNSRGDWLIHTLGNLTFNVSNINLDDNDVSVTQSHHYYLMVNFEIDINNGLKKLYRGVTLALSNHLELY